MASKKQSKKQSRKGSGELKDLKDRKTADGRPENVTGGAGGLLDDSTPAQAVRLMGSVGGKLATAGSSIISLIGTQSTGQSAQ